MNSIRNLVSSALRSPQPSSPSIELNSNPAHSSSSSAFPSTSQDASTSVSTGTSAALSPNPSGLRSRKTPGTAEIDQGEEGRLSSLDQGAYPTRGRVRSKDASEIAGSSGKGKSLLGIPLLSSSRRQNQRHGGQGGDSSSVSRNTNDFIIGDEDDGDNDNNGKFKRKSKLNTSRAIDEAEARQLHQQQAKQDILQNSAYDERGYPLRQSTGRTHLGLPTSSTSSPSTIHGLGLSPKKPEPIAKSLPVLDSSMLSYPPYLDHPQEAGSSSPSQKSLVSLAPSYHTTANNGPPPTIPSPILVPPSPSNSHTFPPSPVSHYPSGRRGSADSATPSYMSTSGFGSSSGFGWAFGSKSSYPEFKSSTTDLNGHRYNGLKPTSSQSNLAFAASATSLASLDSRLSRGRELNDPGYEGLGGTMSLPLDASSLNDDVGYEENEYPIEGRVSKDGQRFGSSGLKSILNWRALANLGTLIILVATLLTLFAGYPIISEVVKSKPSTPNLFSGILAGTDTSIVLPNITNSFGLIDADTPESAMTWTSLETGDVWDLVFSDEFNTDGRSFNAGDDPYWEAGNQHYWSTNNLEWYDPRMITTEGGSLKITLDTIPNHGLNYSGGILTSWNKFVSDWVLEIFSGNLSQKTEPRSDRLLLFGF